MKESNDKKNKQEEGEYNINMSNYKIGIVGYGYVGKGMHRMFEDWVTSIYSPQLELKDVLLFGEAKINLDKESFKDVDLAVISVPTAMKEDGQCDVSLVESTMEWLHEVGVKLVVIKSTVEPGTTQKLQEKYPYMGISFSPEFMGEGNYFTPFWKYPDPINPVSHGFMIIGGKRSATKNVVDIFIRKMGPHTTFMQTDSKTAEVVKYMENLWGAQKVTFANEMYNCCEALGVDYREVREGWALDPRVEKMHTAVFEKARGYSGKCFPKDIGAFIYAVKKAGYNPDFFDEVVRTNNRIRKVNGLDEV